MPAGIEITNTDYTAEEFRELARKSKNRAEAGCESGMATGFGADRWI